jgi:PTH2 family peptidyl-tRNA hydrolase
MQKQVIVVRKDLKMDKGKLAAQVAHASLEAYKKADASDVAAWEAEGMKKVVVCAKDIKEFIEIKEMARKEKLPYAIIHDAGKTQLRPGTVTTLGIGPADEKVVDRVTKHLKLL